MPEVEPRHAPERSRFEAEVDGVTAVLDYDLEDDDTVVFTHTGVPDEIGGRGVGSALARFGLEWARVEGLSVVPRCPFVHGYIERHPEYVDLVADDYPRRDDFE